MASTAPSPRPQDRWQLLAETNVPAGQDFDPQISAWLLEALRPLELHSDLANRVQKTAQESLTQLEKTGLEPALALVCLRVYAPARSLPKRRSSQNWGFFHIKKAGFSGSGENTAGTLIEFYFSLEG